VVLSHLSQDKTQYSLGSFAFSLFHRLSDTNAVAANVKYSPKAEKTKVEAKVGFERKINKKLTGKLRLANSGHVTVAIRQLIGKHVTLIASSDINAINFPSYGIKSYQFGYKIKIS
jgi:hypothetical protein